MLSILDKCLDFMFNQLDWLVPVDYISDIRDVYPGCRIRAFITEINCVGDLLRWNTIRVVDVDAEGFSFIPVSLSKCNRGSWENSDNIITGSPVVLYVSFKYVIGLIS